MEDKYPIRLGYACISNELRGYDVFTSRGLILKTANTQGIEYVHKLIEANVDDLFKILIYNEAHGIRFFRISSCIFPHLGNPQLSYGDYDISFVKEKLKMIGKYAKEHGHRLTMHPGQFVGLGSPRNDVVRQSIIDLENHAKLFRMLNLTPKDGSVMIIHGGGIFGDKKQTLLRWKDNFKKLAKNISEYIVLENDENSYGIMDLLPLCEELQIPFCMDIFHNRVSKDRISITRKLVKRIFNTWKIREIVPKIHVSEQEFGLRRGAHSKTINKLPIYLFRLPVMFHTPFDIMLEVKDKDTSVFKMYHKYFDIHMQNTGYVYYTLKK